MKNDLLKFGAKAGFVYILVILTILVGSITFYAFVVKPANENDNKSTTYYVQGTATRKVTPDTATITVGTTVDGTNLINLQTAVNTKVNQAITDIKALGVKSEDIQTSNYAVDPQYNTKGDKIVGYKITVSLRVTVRNTKPEDNAVSNVIAKATAAGLNDVTNLSFSIDKQEEIQNDLKLEAIDNAKAKAKEQAKKAGLKLGKVTNVSESSYYPYYDYSKSNMAETSSAPSAAGTDAQANTVSRVQIQPGQYELSSYVTVYYEIK